MRTALLLLPVALGHMPIALAQADEEVGKTASKEEARLDEGFLLDGCSFLFRGLGGLPKHTGRETQQEWKRD